MYAYKRLSEALKEAVAVPFDDTSKIVIISDCHRGDGSWADDFAKNQNLYFSALNHYYHQNYTYIELGDGEELWENKSVSDIITEHSDAYWLLSRYHKSCRFYMIYGNHDMVKKNNKFVRENLYEYFDEREQKWLPLFENIQIYQSLVLTHKKYADSILLLHGHQADYLNDRLWKLARFLVRHLWRPLELIGVHDPTSAAKNYKLKASVGQKMADWCQKENQMLIAGHTHRSVFPEPGEPRYFNDGSCVHPRCITAIEIVFGSIMLVKWAFKTRDDGTVYVGREVLAGPKKLSDYLVKLPDNGKNFRMY